MRSVLTALLLFPLSMKAQFYYHDIMGVQETNNQFKTYKALSVTRVSATAYNENNLPDAAFSENQVINTAENYIRTTTINSGTTSNEISYFDAEGRISRSVDSSSSLLTTTTYRYDAAGRILQMTNTLTDTVANISETETHQWLYDADGAPLKMIRVINNTDSTEFRLKKDEDGNIIEETTYKRNRPGEVVYYYYNDNNLLSDIVRFNTKAQRLLPDFMFEYDAEGRVIQKITTLSNNKIGYIIWRYKYDERGLKVKEADYDKEKRLIGRIDYSYSF